MSKEFFQIKPLIHLVFNYIWPNSILLQVFPIHNTISSWSLNNKPPKDQKVCFLQKDKDLWDTNRRFFVLDNKKIPRATTRAELYLSLL